MKFELNLIENSYDYIKETLYYYKKIGYNESHDEDRNSIEEKRKWKTTFILLVQAIELLLKEALFRINESLIYENIDEKISDKAKTITYSKSIARLQNLKPKLFSKNETDLLITCGNIRNKFIHFKVNANSIEIKRKYCKLFELYIKLHYRIFHHKYQNEEYKYVIENILHNAKDFEVFRGIEFTKKQLKQFKEDIEENQYYSYILTKDNNAYKRIKYGDEDKFYNYKFNTNDSYYSIDCKYCGDCGAKKGEIHLDGCDWEMCPICGHQLISCDCEWGEYISDDYLLENDIRDIIDYEMII